MNISAKNISLVLISTIALSSCSMTAFKQHLGLEREQPDEFMVLPRQQLKVPDKAIPLPAPSDKKQAAADASKNAQKLMFGEGSTDNAATANSPLENSVAQKADGANDSIRQQVDAEHDAKTGVMGTERGGTLESILDPFGYNAPKEPVVDAKAENTRVKDALKNGEKIDATKVATKDPRKDQWKSSKNSDDQGPVVDNSTAPAESDRDLTSEPNLK